MAGYDPAENLLYLTVQVRDDHLVVGGSDYRSTDACEVYMDGDRRSESVSIFRLFGESADDLPVLQYVAIPGTGAYGSGHKGNPSLYRGDIVSTRTQMAYTRQGDITTYEWAIQAFDRYPDARTLLEPGMTIGFDMVVVDKDDVIDTPAWISWTPGTGKYGNADLLGALVLAEKPAE